MAAESRWYGQKPMASDYVKQSVANGPKTLGEVLSGLQEQGVNVKNARKAVYAEVMAGTVAMSGKWSDEAATLTRGNA